MSTLKARTFLYKISSLMELQKETFSREEITKKINEIKYLVAQKRTPRFVLKKEILFLEEELNTVLDLERSLQKSRGQESTQVKLLKRKIDILKKRLAIAEDKDLPKKVEKLSHLLGDLLAKYGTQEDIDVSNKLLTEVSVKKLKKIKKDLPAPLSLNKEKVQALLDRVLSLKFELVRIRGLPHNTVTPELEGKLSMIEEKLRSLLAKLPSEGPHVTETHVQVTVASTEVKHDLLFGAPAVVQSTPVMEIVPPSIAVNIDSELFTDLPLPPPPRVKG